MSCVTMYLFCFAPSIANPEHFNLDSIELNVLWSDRTETFPLKSSLTRRTLTKAYRNLSLQ